MTSLTESIVATVDGLSTQGSDKHTDADPASQQDDGVWLPQEPLTKIDRVLDEVCRVQQLQVV